MPYLCKSVLDPYRLDRTSKMTDFGMLEWIQDKAYRPSTRPGDLQPWPILVHDCWNELLLNARYLHRYYPHQGRVTVAFAVGSYKEVRIYRHKRLDTIRVVL